MTIQTLLDELQGRLPELEWKLGQRGGYISIKALPRGLFHIKSDITAAACIAEIRTDIQTLGKQESEYTAFYLAERIRQKINVLVMLCQARSKAPRNEERIAFGIQAISTRQQWLKSLEQDIELLKQQRLVMLNALEQMNQRGNTDGFLDLQGQLGALEKKLTMAEENYKVCTG